MAKWLKITLGVLFSFVILSLAAGYIFNSILKATLPDYEGKINSQEVSSEILIFRDSMAIPYIKAVNDEDAAFAIGYLHAQERLFMMDFARRAGSGELAEVIGPKALVFDKMFRTIGIRRIAQENINHLNPEIMSLLKAYSKGVTQYIREAKGHYPIEFDVLGYDPKEWTPVDSEIMIRMLAWELNLSWWADFSFSDIVTKMGEAKTKEILPKYDENGPYIIPSSLKEISQLPLDLIQTDREFRKFAGFSGTHLGSNAWVVNGNKSVSGKPIIANDPHLSLSAPGQWYAAVIKSGNKTIAGLTLPGVPGIVIGKNDNISWTLTNVMADDCDFYNEQIDSTGRKYLLNGEWKEISFSTERIKVKDLPDEIIKIRSTHRGPIISDIHPYNILYSNKGIRYPVLSMRWTGSDITDEFLSFYKINKSETWEDFKQAAHSFNVPGQNFIYADKSGNIGYVFGARLPVRSNNSPTFIYDGKTTASDWQGYVPENNLPALFNPAQNFIASANNKTIKDFPYHISNIWEPSSRIERITKLLTIKDKYSVWDFKQYQMDQVSPYAEKITAYILNSFREKKIKDNNLNLALELLSKWDYDFNEFSQVPLIYAVFYKHLMKNIYYDEMGHDLYNEFIFMPNIAYRSVLQVLSDSTNSWFDNVRTPQIEQRDEIIRKSLTDALMELENRLGKDLTYWNWGQLHKVYFRHAFSGYSSLIDKFINIGPYSIGGDGTTLFNTEYAFSEVIKGIPRLDHEEFESIVGPSMRFIYDFADPDKFYLVLTTGQSGNIISGHYRDMTEMWLNGWYITVRTDENSFSKNPRLLVISKR